MSLVNLTYSFLDLATILTRVSKVSLVSFALSQHLEANRTAEGKFTLPSLSIHEQRW